MSIEGPDGSEPAGEEATITGAMLLQWAEASVDLEWIREAVKPTYELVAHRSAVSAPDGFVQVWVPALVRNPDMDRTDPLTWGERRDARMLVEEQRWRDAVAMSGMTEELLQDDDWGDKGLI